MHWNRSGDGKRDVLVGCTAVAFLGVLHEPPAVTGNGISQERRPSRRFAYLRSLMEKWQHIPTFHLLGLEINTGASVLLHFGARSSLRETGEWYIGLLFSM